MSEPRNVKTMSRRDLENELLQVRELLKQQLEAAPGTGAEVIVQGIVSMRTGDPVVSMRAGEAAWQMTPAQARQHALIILDSAVEAERDAATVAFLKQSEDMDERQVGGFLFLMRQHRKEWMDEFRSQWGHVQPTDDVPKEEI